MKPLQSSITLKDILDNHNVDKEIYRCDVKEFFGWDLPEEKIEVLHDALMEIKNAN